MLVRAGERAERMGDPATAAATYTKAAELRVERTDGAPEAALLWESPSSWPPKPPVSRASSVPRRCSSGWRDPAWASATSRQW